MNIINMNEFLKCFIYIHDIYYVEVGDNILVLVLIFMLLH